MADTRTRTCETCGKWFSSIDDMRRHISLTHTGTKPVVCNICGKRFGSSKQMNAHYKMHREARLQEFSILTKRRQRDVASEPSDTSHTTVGSFHMIPKTLKNYMSEPPEFLNKSFGTRQSFHISNDGESQSKSHEKYSNPVDTNKLPDIRSKTKSSMRTRDGLTTVAESVSLPKLSVKQSIHGPDAGHISAIENVMGVSRVIETSAESHFKEKAESELIRSRMEAVSRAGRSPTPRSFKTRSGLTEYRKPKYLVDKEFWDAGSHVTDRLTGYSPVSGYDPYSQNISDSRGRQRQSAYSFPDIG